VSGALVLAGLGFLNGAAEAQETADITLPTIDVSTRIRTGTVRGPASTVGGAAGDLAPASGNALAGIGIVGASTSVITGREIERSPAQSLPDILSQQAGIQVQHLLSGTNGSRDAVDLRGFGAFAQSNVLILVNGRRYQDFDLQGFDFSSIPINGIERIEITRGNSGTVLYGDGAIGGVINIVTKSGPAAGFAGRVEGFAGSFNDREGRASASSSVGPWSTSVFGNAINSDGYRTNSKLWQRNAVGNVTYGDRGWAGYFNIAGDEQRQGLPGGLFNVTRAFPFTLATPRASTTPLDHAEKQGVNITAGVVAPIAPGAALTVDGGVRRKFQQSTFFNYFNNPLFVFDPSTAAPSSFIDTVMTTSSITPRLDVAHGLFGVPNRLKTGIDYYNTAYLSDRYQAPSTPPIHRYDIKQTTVAYYAMNTTAVTPNMDVSLGGRLQRNAIKARDDYNAVADPNFFFFGSNPQAPPLNSSERQYAAHAGAEYRFNAVFAVFGRAAHAFRLPNADERVGAGNPFGLTAPANFALKTQTSNDVEGGVRFTWSRFSLESSVYDMVLNNEIHFIPALQQDINLDPTRRTGWESTAIYQATDNVRLRGGAAYVRAIFRQGPFAGNDIPLVSRWTGNAGASWDIFKKYLVLDVAARFWGHRRMDNDQANLQPVIPGNATADVKLGGTYERFFWSAAVLNAFNNHYYDYAIASSGFPAGIFGPAIPPTIGVFTGYPQAGRTFLVQAGATF
jgi:iron complex outermembrane receptor protein